MGSRGPRAMDLDRKGRAGMSEKAQGRPLERRHGPCCSPSLRVGGVNRHERINVGEMEGKSPSQHPSSRDSPPNSLLPGRSAVRFRHRICACSETSRAIKGATSRVSIYSCLVLAPSFVRLSIRRSVARLIFFKRRFGRHVRCVRSNDFFGWIQQPDGSTCHAGTERGAFGLPERVVEESHVGREGGHSCMVLRFVSEPSQSRGVSGAHLEIGNHPVPWSRSGVDSILCEDCKKVGWRSPTDGALDSERKRAARARGAFRKLNRGERSGARAWEERKTPFTCVETSRSGDG